MKEIFERLGLVIHWIGFLIGCGISVLAFSILIGEYPNNSSLITQFTFTVIGPVLGTIPTWAIRFILTGNKIFFPWRS
jgi:hypothetical protein